MKKMKNEKRCNFCGKKMGIDLDICPNCNKKYIPLKKVILYTFIGMGAFILIAVLISISILNSDKTYTIINNEQVTKEYYSLNEIVTCNNEEITVINIQEKSNNDDLGISKGKKLIAITYKITNKSSSEKTYYSWYFDVITKNGEIISSKPAVITSMWNNEFLNSPTLSSNGKKEGYLVYELDEDDNNYYIQYQCKSFPSKVYIKIKP